VKEYPTEAEAHSVAIKMAAMEVGEKPPAAFVSFLEDMVDEWGRLLQQSDDPSTLHELWKLTTPQPDEPMSEMVGTKRSASLEPAKHISKKRKLDTPRKQAKAKLPPVRNKKKVPLSLKGTRKAKKKAPLAKSSATRAPRHKGRREKKPTIDEEPEE